MCKDFCKHPMRCPQGCSLEKKPVPHKHADLIKAWADGAEIQIYGCEGWDDCPSPGWADNCYYRVKPEPKPDRTFQALFVFDGRGISFVAATEAPTSRGLGRNVTMVFDGESGALKSVEKI